MKRVLITGKNSYIGTAFADWVKAHAAELKEEIQVDFISLRDDKWQEADFGVYDSILHVAGIAHVDIRKVTESQKQQYFKVNRDLTLRVAKKAQEEGCRQFIFLSSIIVYGDSAPMGKRRIIKADTVPEPTNFYGESKLLAEEGLKELNFEAKTAYAGSGFAKPAMRLCILRPPMVYGQGCKGNYRLLQKMAKHAPFFPDVINERSVIRIDNLCRFISLMILNQEEGTFFPQDRLYACTSQIVRQLGAEYGRDIPLTKVFFPQVLRILSGKGRLGATIDKAFGNLAYDKEMSRYKEDYHEVSEATRIAARTPIPSATVVTVVRNGEELIGRTIESILAQSRVPAEYIIIDGASTDETVAKAESYRARLFSRGVELRIVSEPDNGLYDAMNKGIAMATGDIIGILNAGDTYEPGTVRMTAETFRKRGCDVTFGNIRIVRPNGMELTKNARLRHFQTSRDWNHPTMFVRRELLQENPFPCKGVHDDYGLYLKLRKQGAKIVTIRKTLATFYMGGVSNKRGLRAAFGRIRDRYRYCYRENGYSRLYIFECIGIEMAKRILG
jgi:nucleoside-diphosphate-sugar epimerase